MSHFFVISLEDLYSDHFFSFCLLKNQGSTLVNVRAPMASQLFLLRVRLVWALWVRTPLASHPGPLRLRVMGSVCTLSQPCVKTCPLLFHLQLWLFVTLQWQPVFYEHVFYLNLLSYLLIVQPWLYQ